MKLQMQKQIVKGKIDILVVEDETPVADFLKEVLEKEGYAIKVTMHGEEAIKIVKQDRPRLVILDLLLPDLDGLAVLKEIRKFDKDVIVFIMTAYSDSVQEMDKYILDVYGELIKPVSAANLRSYVKNALDLKKNN